MLLIAIGVGVRPLNDLLPGFAAEVFQSGAGGLSILASATAAGAIIGGLWLGHGAQSSRLAMIAIAMALGGAMASTVVCSTQSMWVAVPAIAVFGFCVSSTGIAIKRSFNCLPSRTCGAVSWAFTGSCSAARLL